MGFDFDFDDLEVAEREAKQGESEVLSFNEALAISAHTATHTLARSAPSSSSSLHNGAANKTSDSQTSVPLQSDASSIACKVRLYESADKVELNDLEVAESETKQGESEVLSSSVDSSILAHTATHTLARSAPSSSISLHNGAANQTSDSQTSVPPQSDASSIVCKVRPYESADKVELNDLEVTESEAKQGESEVLSSSVDSSIPAHTATHTLARSAPSSSSSLDNGAVNETSDSQTLVPPQSDASSIVCKVRPYESADKVKLSAIEHSCFKGSTEALSEYIRCASDPTPKTFVNVAVEWEGAIVGYVAWRCQQSDGGPPYITILSIAVLEWCRGLRIGELLLKEVEAETSQRFPEAERMRLQVRDDNFSALCLYQRFGFRKIAKLLDYYGDCDGMELMCDTACARGRRWADPEPVAILCCMGFEEKEAHRALRWTQGNVDTAVALLTEDLPVLLVVRVPVRNQPPTQQRCSACGSSRNLEYNPVGKYCTVWDRRLYCTDCWKSWLSWRS